jgi:hypothetical protein
MNEYSAELIQASVILRAAKAVLASLPETINPLAARTVEDAGPHFPFHGWRLEEVYFCTLCQFQRVSYPRLYIVSILDIERRSCHLLISLSLEIKTLVQQISIGKGVEEELT